MRLGFFLTSQGVVNARMSRVTKNQPTKFKGDAPCQSMGSLVGCQDQRCFTRVANGSRAKSNTPAPAPATPTRPQPYLLVFPHGRNASRMVPRALKTTTIHSNGMVKGM